LEKRLDAEEMAAEQKEAEERAMARDAGLQRAKGLFSLLKNDLRPHQHEALVDGMIDGLERLRDLQREQLEEAAAKVEQAKKTYCVWANIPWYCHVKADSEEEAKRVAEVRGDWGACDDKYQPTADDIYEVLELDSDHGLKESDDA
jgi:hypothetical protein